MTWNIEEHTWSAICRHLSDIRNTLDGFAQGLARFANAVTELGHRVETLEEKANERTS